MVQNGKTLSMKNEAIWKGTYTHNGTLLKLHENAYTIGYSALLSPDGTSAGTVKFGDAVFYDAKLKNNQVFVGFPTANTPEPKFAGIVVREPAIASGYPAINDEVTSFQKGLMVKEGYIVYKNVPVVTANQGAIAAPKNAYDNAQIGFVLIASKTNGVVYLATNAETKSDAQDVVVGKVVELNPDDKSVTVYISPAIYA